MDGLIVGASCQTSAKTQKRYGRLYVVKDKTMQPGVTGREACTLDATPEAADKAVMLISGAKGAAIKADIALDFVTFGDTQRIGVVDFTPKDGKPQG